MTARLLTLPGEEWRPCGDGRYAVSSFGRVKRTARAKGASVGRILRQHLHRDGRLCVHVTRADGRYTYRGVARLVLEAFQRKPERGEVACYRNQQNRDCRLANVYWSGDPVRLVANRCEHCGRITRPPKRGKRRFCGPKDSGCFAERHRATSRRWWRANCSLAAREKRAA